MSFVSINQVFELVKDDLAKVDAAIQNELNSDVVLIKQLGNYKYILVYIGIYWSLTY